VTLSLDLSQHPAVPARGQEATRWILNAMLGFTILLLGIIAVFFVVYAERFGLGGAEWLLVSLPPVGLYFLALRWGFQNEADPAVRMDVGREGMTLVGGRGRVRTFRFDSRWLRLDLVDGRGIDWKGEPPHHPRTELRSRWRLEAFVPETEFQRLLETMRRVGLRVEPLVPPFRRPPYRAGTVAFRVRRGRAAHEHDPAGVF
jgi:hypothetical protein